MSDNCNFTVDNTTTTTTGTVMYWQPQPVYWWPLQYWPHLSCGCCRCCCCCKCDKHKGKKKCKG